MRIMYAELRAIEHAKTSKYVSAKDLPWSSKEIQTLIRGVFRYGENEWYELLLDGEDDGQAGGYHASRTANHLAAKWRQIKAVMMADIKKVRLMTKGEKIVTKNEWMVAALEALEAQDRKGPKPATEEVSLYDEETPQMLYEALFIDPSKLTPYQHA